MRVFRGIRTVALWKGCTATVAITAVGSCAIWQTSGTSPRRRDMRECGRPLLSRRIAGCGGVAIAVSFLGAWPTLGRRNSEACGTCTRRFLRGPRSNCSGPGWSFASWSETHGDTDGATSTAIHSARLLLASAEMGLLLLVTLRGTPPDTSPGMPAVPRSLG